MAVCYVYHWLFSFHNGLRHTCSLKLVSISRVTLWKVVMKYKIVMFLTFWALFLKILILRFQNFISPSIKYPINFIFSMVVCICKINVSMGWWVISNHTKFMDHVTLISYITCFVEIFTSGRYHKDMKALKILASNSKHFRV